MKPVPAMPARRRVVTAAPPAFRVGPELEVDITSLLQDYCTREAEVNPQRGKVAEQVVDQVDNLALVLAGVRTGGLHTRPELVRELGLGRNVISQRVGQLLEIGLL